MYILYHLLLTTYDLRFTTHYSLLTTYYSLILLPQYVQWYKVLCWLLIMVIGGSDGLLPPVARDAFRIEELLLTSDARALLAVAQ